MELKENVIKHQQKIALAVGFVAVAFLGYFGGQSINTKQTTQPAKSSSQSNLNYTQDVKGAQTETKTVVETTKDTSTTTSSGPLNCAGKIKGSTSMIYHMPDGSFYKRVTNPIRCFDSETEAKAAGFRKSSR